MGSEDTISGSFKSTKQTITSTAALLPTTSYAARKALLIKNTGSVTVYLGDRSVDTDGYPLEVGDELSFLADDNAALYAVTDSSDGEIITLEGN